MKPALLDQHYAIATNALQQGGRLLVVGGRASNFPVDLRTHPRIVYYDSADSRNGIDHRVLPANVRLVLFTRFVAHRTHQWFRSQANARGVHCFPALLNTGQIREILSAVRSVPDLPPELQPCATVVAPPEDRGLMPFNPPVITNARELAAAPLHAEHQPDPPARAPFVPEGMVRSASGKLYTKPQPALNGNGLEKGAVARFIAEAIAHRPELRTQSIVKASLVVFADAESIQLPTTLASVRQGMGVLYKREATTPDVSTPAPSAPAPAPPPPPVLSPIVPDSRLASDSIKLLDDVMAGLQLLREQLTLDASRMQLVVQQETRKRLQELLDRQE